MELCQYRSLEWKLVLAKYLEEQQRLEREVRTSGVSRPAMVVGHNTSTCACARVNFDHAPTYQFAALAKYVENDQ